MAAQGESIVQLPLVGGITETVISEQTGGAILSSVNTRLSQDKGSLAPRPKWLAHGNPASPAPHCYGVFPGCGDSALAIFAADHGPRRIVPSSLDEQLLKSANAVLPAPNYIAASVTQAGGVNTTRAGGPPSVCIDNDGNIWTAWRSEGDPGEVRIYAEVHGADGSLLAPRAVVAAFTTTGLVSEQLAGWTALIATSIGVSVVYTDASDDSFHSGYELINGSIAATYAAEPSAIATSGDKTRWRQDACASGGGGMFSVSSTGDTTAVLWYEPLVPPFSGAAFASITTAYDLSGAGAKMASAVCTFTRAGIRYVAVATGALTSAPTDVQVCLYTFNGVFTLVWQSAIVLTYAVNGAHSLAIQPHHEGGTPGMILCVTGNTAGGFQPCVTSTSWISMSGVADNDAEYNLAARLSGRGGSYAISENDTYAMFPLCAQSRPDDFGQHDLTSPLIIPDPALHLCMAKRTPALGEGAGSSRLTPIARLGTDGAYPAAHTSSSWMAVVGARAVLGYAMVDYTGGTHAAIPRWAELNLRLSEQPSFARDSGGVATIAAAHPIAWDGSEMSDVTGLHAPVFCLIETIAAGDPDIEVLPVGRYGVRAIFRYRDGSGNLRRSAPSLPYIVATTETDAVNLRFAFADPIATRTSPGSSPPDCVVYITETDGSIFYYSTTAERDPTNGFFIVSQLHLPSLRADGIGERLYSTGADNEPLLPMAPPALYDVIAVGPRHFGIGGEYRNRVWATKLKERDVALEWCGELTVDFGEQAGRLVKLVSVGGLPRVLAERGVWAITQDGPDNSGSGGFGDPQLISTRGCRSRESVAVVPGVGVFYEGEDGVLTLLGGEGVKRFETIQPRRLGSPSIYLNQHEVAWPVKDSDGMLVYNFLQDAFTTWSGLDRIAHARCDVTSADGSTTTIAMDASAVLVSMNAETPDYTAHMSVDRGWIAPAGPDADCVARELWIRLLKPVSGAMNHLVVRVEFDYGQGPAAVQREWSAAELTNPVLLRGDRVTLCVNLHGTPCRSMRLLVGDGGLSNGSPMRPLGAELLFGVNPANLRRVLPRAAMK